MHSKTLSTAIKALSKNYNIEITSEISLLLCDFLNLLNNWNKVHNLTAHKNMNTMIKEHIVDAWTALIPLKKKNTK
jgi:16S rRNA G527 N7-methylase RsmG